MGERRTRQLACGGGISVVKLMLCRIRGDSPQPSEEPLGLLALATYLRKMAKDTQIEITDCEASLESPERLVARVLHEGYDLFCVSLLTSTVKEGFLIAKMLKESRTNVTPIIVFGGPHATASPRECISKGADICVIGEGEATLLEIIAWYRSGAVRGDLRKIDGIAFQFKNGQVCETPKRQLIDIADVHPISYDFVAEYKYHCDAHLTDRGGARPMMFSRGCVNDCSFCSSKLTWRRISRRVDPIHAVKEIQQSCEEGYRYFHLYDDDLLISPQWVRRFAEEIISRRLGIKYTGLASCGSFLKLDAGTLERVMASGLTLIEIGVESLIPEVLSLMGKRQNVQGILSVFDKARKHNLDIYPLLMIMCPGETIASHVKQDRIIRRIVDSTGYLRKEYGSEAGVFLRNAAFYTPYPGTSAWATRNTAGRIVDRNWTNWNVERLCFVPNTLLLDKPIVSLARESGNVHELCRLADRVLNHDNEYDHSDLIGDVIDYFHHRADGSVTVLNISRELRKQNMFPSLSRSIAVTVMVALAGSILQDSQSN